MNFNVNYGLWVMVMCQCKSINCSKCTTVVRDIDNGGGYVYRGAESLWEVSVPSSQFCCEPKTALKKMSKKKKKGDDSKNRVPNQHYYINHS